MELERPKSVASLQAADPNFIPDESEREALVSPSVMSWHHTDMDEPDSSTLGRVHSEPLLDNQPAASRVRIRSRQAPRAKSAGAKKKMALPRFGKTNAVHPANSAEEAEQVKSLENDAWNQDVTGDSLDHDMDVGMETSGYKTPPPRFGSSKARVAPAPEGLVETDNALKRLNVVLKKRNSTSGVSIASVSEEEPAVDSEQESSPSLIECIESRPTSKTSFFNRKSTPVPPSIPTHGSSTPVNIFKSHSVSPRPDSVQSRPSNSRRGSVIVDTLTEGNEGPSLSSHSVVSVEEATGEMIMQQPMTPTSKSTTHQQYIPLHSAQKALARVVSDMHLMKERHVHIVGEIEDAYRDIEDESRLQYKSYIQHLRKHHTSKMAVYKQVVKLLQEEIDKMKEYWEGTTTSLASRNRELLLENKTLYDQLKTRLKQMDRDKEKIVHKFTRRIEKERKRKDEELKKARQAIEAMNTKCTDMVKTTEENASTQLSKERDSYNQNLEELQKQLAEKEARIEDLAKKQQVVVAEHSLKRKRSESTTSTPEVHTKPPVETEHQLKAQAPTDVQEKEGRRLSDQTSGKMKEAIHQAQKELNVAQTQLHSMLGLFGSEPSLREAFQHTLEEINQRLSSLRGEKEEREEIISEWYTNFKEDNQEEPTEDDWKESVSEAKSQLESIDSEIHTLEERATTLHTVQLSFDSQGETIALSRHNLQSVHHKTTQAAKFSDNLAQEDITDEGDNLRTDIHEHKDGDEEEEEEGMATEFEDHNEGDIEDDETEQETPSADVADGETVADDNEPVTGEPELKATDDEEEGDEKLGQEEDSYVDIETTELEADHEVKPVTKKSEKEAVASKREAQSKAAQRARGQKESSMSDSKQKEELKKTKEELTKLKKQWQADQSKLKALEKELKGVSKAGGGSVEDKRELKKREKELKELTKQKESAAKTIEKIQAQLKANDAELTTLKKENDKLLGEATKSSEELEKLSKAAKDGIEAAENLKSLEIEVKKQAAELKTTVENYNSERVLRKKYYNVIEDMKGKIRVYCRVRPLSGSEKARNNFSVIESPDEYTLIVRTQRKLKEFQFDQVFTEEQSQDKVFEDSKNLIQSAVDGYNVCIFAYGQTGSGKTYTMIGGKDATNRITAPGIAPRAFESIFQLVDANRKKYRFEISCYMLELYNDKLLDLFQTSNQNLPRLDIKKDKKGMVVIHGAVMHQTSTAEGLLELFNNGSKNRHIASTKMNAESSRSHLVIGVVIESTNLANGTVHRGKLSLVDLAGSERASKTGATAEQLKEAQSINKSLSALGDVISALSSGQDFVPYRNNKLTMLMQDSLGGNAKTLMFVNISPADYNADETVISLTYAARVKLITNDASKNADNKEIARLKGIIVRLRKGEEVVEDEL